jgi:hypothetical protein
VKGKEVLLNVLADQLGHFKHGDSFLATEDDFEFVVGVDIGPFLLVLQAVLFYVGPQLLGHLGSCDCLSTDDSAQSSIGLYRFHESRVRFPFFLCSHCSSFKEVN